MQTTIQKVALGQLLMTRGVSNLIANYQTLQQFISSSVSRHALGDWGDVCKDDHMMNEDGLINGRRLFSVYKLSDENIPIEKIWIITEADRSVTTILLPSEY